MSDDIQTLRELVSALKASVDTWKLVAYTLAGVVVALSGVIAKMAHWIIKKRDEIAEQYKNLMLDLNNNLDRMGDYLKEIYNREVSNPKERTEFDFKINDRKNK